MNVRRNRGFRTVVDLASALAIIGTWFSMISTAAKPKDASGGTPAKIGSSLYSNRIGRYWRNIVGAQVALHRGTPASCSTHLESSPEKCADTRGIMTPLIYLIHTYLTIPLYSISICRFANQELFSFLSHIRVTNSATSERFSACVQSFF